MDDDLDDVPLWRPPKAQITKTAVPITDVYVSNSASASTVVPATQNAHDTSTVLPTAASLDATGHNKSLSSPASVLTTGLNGDPVQAAQVVVVTLLLACVLQWCARRWLGRRTRNKEMLLQSGPEAIRAALRASTELQDVLPRLQESLRAHVDEPAAAAVCCCGALSAAATLCQQLRIATQSDASLLLSRLPYSDALRAWVVECARTITDVSAAVAHERSCVNAFRSRLQAIRDARAGADAGDSVASELVTVAAGLPTCRCRETAALCEGITGDWEMIVAAGDETLRTSAAVRMDGLSSAPEKLREALTWLVDRCVRAVEHASLEEIDRLEALCSEIQPDGVHYPLVSLLDCQQRLRDAQAAGQHAQRVEARVREVIDRGRAYVQQCLGTAHAPPATHLQTRQRELQQLADDVSVALSSWDTRNRDVRVSRFLHPELRGQLQQLQVEVHAAQAAAPEQAQLNAAWRHARNISAQQRLLLEDGSRHATADGPPAGEPAPAIPSTPAYIEDDDVIEINTAPPAVQFSEISAMATDAGQGMIISAQLSHVSRMLCQKLSDQLARVRDAERRIHEYKLEAQRAARHEEFTRQLEEKRQEYAARLAAEARAAAEQAESRSRQAAARQAAEQQAAVALQEVNAQLFQDATSARKELTLGLLVAGYVAAGTLLALFSGAFLERWLLPTFPWACVDVPAAQPSGYLAAAASWVSMSSWVNSVMSPCMQQQLLTIVKAIATLALLVSTQRISPSLPLICTLVFAVIVLREELRVAQSQAPAFAVGVALLVATYLGLLSTAQGLCARPALTADEASAYFLSRLDAHIPGSHTTPTSTRAAPSHGCVRDWHTRTQVRAAAAATGRVLWVGACAGYAGVLTIALCSPGFNPLPLLLKLVGKV